MKYRLIPDFPNYWAGSDGHIYSTKFGYARQLKEGFDGKQKYYHVTLRKQHQSYVLNVHRLICLAFNGIPKPKLTASHLDGNTINNVPTNLVWESLSKNHRRKIEHGTDDCGHRNSRALFTKKQILIIKNLLYRGFTSRELSRIYNTDERNIGKIKRGEHYARV